ncbi:hypothetical protein LOAG_05650 [Loa loa]|uniref:Uncharacterized protein n=1 Tax=Loa loa TaxID=7209 RepID=A0A1S0TZG0_LOALO|nr:hypothetical protein LOAG_05650 [Loa loa]EFO22833.1 hypothetical protein LOAG_05650 [Loa loa]
MSYQWSHGVKNRSINTLYPLKVNDEEKSLDVNDKEDIKIQSNHQEIDKPGDSIALRTRSTTKRQFPILPPEIQFPSIGNVGKPEKIYNAVKPTFVHQKSVS